MIDVRTAGNQLTTAEQAIAKIATQDLSRNNPAGFEIPLRDTDTVRALANVLWQYTTQLHITRPNSRIFENACNTTYDFATAADPMQNILE